MLRYKTRRRIAGGRVMVAQVVKTLLTVLLLAGLMVGIMYPYPPG